MGLPRARQGRAGVVTALVVTVWLALVLFAFSALARHAATAGLDAQPLGRWPLASGLVRRAGRPTLVVFVHPRCPCTRATLRTLERIVSRHPAAAEVRVVFRDGGGARAEAGPLWAMAGRVPGAVRVLDVGHREATRFGAQTSGLVMLFDADGALRFRGGVTASRGHEGESEGGAALDAALARRQGVVSRAAVFGCGL